jgi:DnaK suppressor protein
MEINTTHFKELLLSEKSRLEKELETIGVNNPDRVGDWQVANDDSNRDRADEEEVADSLMNTEDNNSILTQLEIQLQDVYKSLARIENNTYGSCEICGEMIETDRLEATPSAQTCKKHMN